MISTIQQQADNWKAAEQEEELLLELFNAKPKVKPIHPALASRLKEEGGSCLRDN